MADTVCPTLSLIDTDVVSNSENTSHVILVITGVLFSLLLYFVLLCRHLSLYVYFRRSL